MAMEPKKKKKAKDKAFDLQEFIVRELRRAFRRAPMYNEALNRAKHEYFIESKKGKPMRRVHFQCVYCKKFFNNKEKSQKVAVDHIVPVIDVQEGFQNFDSFVLSLFCSVDNLQVLCNYPKDKSDPDRVESCHKVKTRLENEERNKAKKERQCQ